MNTQLFGPPDAGGSFADKVAKARQFFDGARGLAAEAPATVEPVAAAAVEAAPIEAAVVADAAPGAAAPTGIDAAAPVTTAAGHDPDGLAAAARAAAEQSIADPAYAQAATQNVEVIVQPRVMVQGQQGPIVVPVDVAVPAAHTNVTVAPAQAVVLDAATGQVVPAAGAPAGAAAGAVDAAQAAAAPTRGLRSMTAADIGAMFGGGGRAGAAPVAAEAAPAAQVAARPSLRDQLNQAMQAARGPAAQAPTAPVAAAAADAGPVAAAAPGGGGWRSRVEDALGLPKAPGTGSAQVADVAAGAAKPSLLDRIRANTAGVGEVLTRTTPDAAPVADDVVRAAGRSGLMDDLRRAAELAKIANPRG